MIAYLRGQARGTDVVVTADGVGYKVATPRPLEPDAAVELEIASVISRDGETRLFGFPTPDERKLFSALVAVTGVGPAAALALLGGLGVVGLAAAISAQDVAALTRVKGVGAGVATKVVHSAKLPDLEADLDGAVGPGDELVDALVALGYPQGDAQRVAAVVEDSGPDLVDRLPQALALLRGDGPKTPRRPVSQGGH